VQYIKKAADAEPSPEYYFWLGEAYLTKADFVRALYQYKKIVEVFPRDEMWTPTAEFKVGIVLEFMDEIEEAKDVYTSMIKKRGAGDTWAVEAQRRLDELR
jgi:TolA-binding protein